MSMNKQFMIKVSLIFELAAINLNLVYESYFTNINTTCRAKLTSTNKHKNKKSCSSFDTTRFLLE